MDQPIREIKALVQRELDVLYEVASEVYDDHNMTIHPYEQGHVPMDQKPKYHLTLRRRVNTLEISWAKIDFKQYAGKWKRKHIYISLGNRMKYSMRSFGLASEWEYAAIEEAEQKFEAIRKRLDKLKQFAKSSERYCYDYYPEEELENVQTSD